MIQKIVLHESQIDNHDEEIHKNLIIRHIHEILMQS